VTESFVGRNYDLFEKVNDIDAQVASIDKHQTWVLLYTFDKSKSEVRYELSLPTSTAISGTKGKIKICDWQTRIVFPAINFDEFSLPEFNTDFTEDSDFFNIEEK